MKTLKWNGEYWYEDHTPLWNRIATWMLWVGGTWPDPAPVSIFGHRVTYYGWGLRMRLPGGDLLVMSWCGVDRARWFRSKPESVYISPNGTPDHAHTWFVGAPREVREEASKRVSARHRVFGVTLPKRARPEVS